MPNSGVMKRSEGQADIHALPAGRERTTRWYLDRYADPVAREHMADGLRKARYSQAMIVVARESGARWRVRQGNTWRTSG
jgi:hypothetical protein